jgi:hypothetical protein
MAETELRCSLVRAIVVTQLREQEATFAVWGSIECPDAWGASRPLYAQVQSAAYDRVSYVTTQFRGCQAGQGWLNSHAIPTHLATCLT